VAQPILPGAVEAFAGAALDTPAFAGRDRVDPRPLIAATVGLDEVAAVLAGTGAHDRVPGAPKTHVDPRI